MFVVSIRSVYPRQEVKHVGNSGRVDIFAICAECAGRDIRFIIPLAIHTIGSFYSFCRAGIRLAHLAQRPREAGEQKEVSTMTIVAGKFMYDVQASNGLYLVTEMRRGHQRLFVVDNKESCTCGGSANQPCRHIKAVKSHLCKGGHRAPEKWSEPSPLPLRRQHCVMPAMAA